MSPWPNPLSSALLIISTLTTSHHVHKWAMGASTIRGHVNLPQRTERRDNPLCYARAMEFMGNDKETKFQGDEIHNINIVEWNKKRKLQSYQLDLLRPKHKCRVGSISSEHASMFDENPVLESAHNHMVDSRIDAAFLDDRSKPKSAKDSNSFIEDSDTSMSVNEETKLEADCANTYLCVNRVSYTEEETFVDSIYNASYDDPDTQAFENSEEHLLGFGSFSGHVYSEYVKDSSDHPVDKEFEDFLFSNGVNPDVYVLSSGRLNTDQEAQSSTRPPTIDEEFEQYFSALML